MKIELFLKSLSKLEKQHLLYYLKKEMDNKTRLNEWLIFNFDKISVRLHNALLYAYEKEFTGFIHIEDINILDIIKLRNVGKRGMEEFIKLRGY